METLFLLLACVWAGMPGASGLGASIEIQEVHAGLHALLYLLLLLLRSLCLPNVPD